MPVQFTKPEPNPATAQRVAEAGNAILEAFRSLAPAVQKCGEEMARSFEQLRTRRPA